MRMGERSGQRKDQILNILTKASGLNVREAGKELQSLVEQVKTMSISLVAVQLLQVVQ